MMLRRRYLLLALTMAVAVAIALWVMRESLLSAMPRWLDIGERPHHADYVLILTGDENTRPFVAAALLKTGFASHALITEVLQIPNSTPYPPHHEIARQVLLKRGIASDDITILPAKATTTYDEAIALKTFLADRPNARAMVVTNDFHTRRSRWIFSRVFGEQTAKLSFVSAPYDAYLQNNWWRDEEGFVTIGTEYLKLAFYLVYYGHLVPWLAACIGLVVVSKLARTRELQP